MKKIVKLIVVLLVCGLCFPGLAIAKKKTSANETVAMPSAPKKTIAVANFANKAGVYSQVNIGDGMADMLADALMKSGKFIVLERQALGSVLAEQNLAASGRATAGTVAATGDIKRAQIVVEGAVTEYEDNASGGGQSVGYMGINVGMKRAKAHLAIILRLIDTTTSQVLLSQRVEGKASRGGLGVSVAGYGVSGGQSGYSSTPIGKAMQQIVDEAVVLVSNTLDPLPWTGKVVKVDGETIFINAGAEAGLKANDVFTVSRMGEILKDPDTGMDLGGEEATIGRVQITDVQGKFSKGKSIEGNSIAAGDRVKYAPGVANA